ncbi:hypothetical protein [Fusibacter bizertensis]
MKINSFIQNITTGLKTNSSTQSKEKSVSETLVQDYKQGLPGQVKSIYDKYKITPTNDDVKEINQFLKNASGTNDEKLMSIDIALYKGISPSEENLTTIQQSLTHDTEVVASLAEVPSTEEPLTKEQSLTLIEHLKLPESIKAALKEMVKNKVPLDRAIVKVAQQLKLDQGKTSISIGELKDLIDSNPKLKALLAQGEKLEQIIKAIQSLKQPTVDGASGEKAGKQANNGPDSAATIKGAEIAYNESSMIDEVGGSKTEKSIENTNLPVERHDEAVLFAVQAREGEANAEINATQTDKSISTNNSISSSASPNEVFATEEETIETVSEEDAHLQMINEAVDTLMTQMSEVFSSLENDLSLKTYLVESTTEATIKAKATFENFKAEVTQLLTPNPETPRSTPAELSSQIATSIEKLNHLILKSEVTLYTDMFTEKKLLLMSSELDKASQMLKQGEFTKAQATVNEAVKLLKQIDFTPSIRRLQVFANQRLEQLENVIKPDQKSDQKLETLIKTQIQTLGDQQGSKLSRDVLETLRFLGLNHEMEVAENLEKGDFETLKERSSANVKEILLKMMKEDSQERTVEATEQNLMNLTGQQMMNDQSSQDQPFYFFNFPVMDGEDLGNMKVFMKGASKNSQMDWQNSELYFGMSLKEVGQVGIRVKIQQAKVDIQVSSERVGKLDAPLKAALQTLSEIGFTAGEVTYKVSQDESPVSLKPSFEKGVTNLSDGKGFDFKV